MRVNTLADMAQEVTPAEARELRRSGATLVDVRRDDEVASRPVPDAIHIPLDELQSRAAELPEGPLVFVCASGERSSFAADALATGGREAYSLAGGAAALA